MQPIVQMWCPECQNPYPNENWKCEKNDKVFCRKIGNFFKFLKISNHILCSHIGVQINFYLYLKHISGDQNCFCLLTSIFTVLFLNLVHENTQNWKTWIKKLKLIFWNLKKKKKYFENPKNEQNKKWFFLIDFPRGPTYFLCSKMSF